MRVGFAADGVGEPLVVVADEAPDAADVDVSGTITGGSDDTGGGAAVVVGGGGGGGLPSTVTVPIATGVCPTTAANTVISPGSLVPTLKPQLSVVAEGEQNA
jgi:hypothetical protein